MEKKTVLLVTLWGYINYGNRLQAFALRNLIERTGYNVVCAVYNKSRGKSEVKRGIKALLGHLGIAKYRRFYCDALRSRALKKDLEKYKPITRTIRHYRTKGIIDPDSFVAAVTGSDQVWHRWAGDNDLPYFYLSFMPQNKRIAYAASFGFEEFPRKDFEYHQKGLQEMRLISCREESGCRLVEQMTGKPGELVLDPTLCIERNIWERLEEKPICCSQKPYLLILMLGSNSVYSQTITRFASEHQLEIIDLFDQTRTDVWKTTMGGFLWLVHHAEYICTDSFHCTVFSILYEKHFTVFMRKDKGCEHMYGRIETLLKQLNLEGNQYDGNGIHRGTYDYEQVMSKLDAAKERSIEWLKAALKSVK